MEAQEFQETPALNYFFPCLPAFRWDVTVQNCTGERGKKREEELKADLEEKGYRNHRRSSAITCLGPVLCLGN